jgi:hypothetical protein
VARRRISHSQRKEIRNEKKSGRAGRPALFHDGLVQHGVKREKILQQAASSSITSIARRERKMEK